MSNGKLHQLDQRYLRMTRIQAENSCCHHRQVGTLVVKGNMIINDGYSGTPSGFGNVCGDENRATRPYVLHAEANAITELARSSNNNNDSTLYVTVSPCIECAELIIQAGVKWMACAKKYKLKDGINLLKKAGIEVICLNINDNETR